MVDPSPNINEPSRLEVSGAQESMQVNKLIVHNLICIEPPLASCTLVGSNLQDCSW